MYKVGRQVASVDKRMDSFTLMLRVAPLEKAFDAGWDLLRVWKDSKRVACNTYGSEAVSPERNAPSPRHVIYILGIRVLHRPGRKVLHLVLTQSRSAFLRCCTCILCDPLRYDELVFELVHSGAIRIGAEIRKG